MKFIDKIFCKALMALVMGWTCVAVGDDVEVESSGFAFTADTRTGTRQIDAWDQLLPITYSGANWTNTPGTATVTATPQGGAATTLVNAANGTGSTGWSPAAGGFTPCPTPAPPRVPRN